MDKNEKKTEKIQVKPKINGQNNLNTKNKQKNKIQKTKTLTTNNKDEKKEDIKIINQSKKIENDAKN